MRMGGYGGYGGYSGGSSSGGTSTGSSEFDEPGSKLKVSQGNTPRAETSLVPRLYILPEARQKMEAYIDIAEGEISGLGIIREIGDNFLIEDVFLLPQEATQASSDIDAQSVAKVQFEMAKKGLPLNSLKLWWHSHADFSVFWSGRDDATVENFAPNWMISVVGNKAGDWCTRIDIFKPARCTVHGLAFETYIGEIDGLRGKLEAEVKLKVKKPAPVVVTGGTGEFENRIPWKYRRGDQSWESFDEQTRFPNSNFGGRPISSMLPTREE